MRSTSVAVRSGATLSSSASDGTRDEVIKLYVALCGGYLCISKEADHVGLQEKTLRVIQMDLQALRGKTLACWCPVGAPCHGDVLLALANNRAISAAWKPRLSRVG